MDCLVPLCNTWISKILTYDEQLPTTFGKIFNIFCRHLKFCGWPVFKNFTGITFFGERLQTYMHLQRRPKNAKPSVCESFSFMVTQGPTITPFLLYVLRYVEGTNEGLCCTVAVHIFCQNPRQIFMKEIIFHKVTSLEHVSLLWNEHLPYII